jgi:hypothetical protein
MTQSDRVLAALSRAGARGITSVDFIRHPTVDGGPPILRVAARIRDLRDQGIEIETDGERDGVAVYKLRTVSSTAPGGDRVVEPAPSAEPSDGRLFDADVDTSHNSAHWKAA